MEPALRSPSIHRASCLLTLIGVLLAATPALAQYKWKDGRGQVHVSDLPPPRDIPDKDVLQRPGPPRRGVIVATSPAPASAASATPAQRAPVDPELEARRHHAEQEAKARAKADEALQAAQRAENCQRARQQLATLNNGQRLVRFNAQGERVVLDDAMRDEEAQVARRVIASDCR
jgi:hypothetical protein